MAPPALNFARGKEFQVEMRRKFGHPVVFSPGFRQKEFILVVSFCRATFRLDIHTVSVVLQSCFGGYPQGFCVHCLKDRTFQFSVASKYVGFKVYNAGRISEKDFEIVFNLWGNGGPLWCREELNFYREQDAEWSLVYRNGRVVNSGDHRREATPANRPISVFQRLSGQAPSPPPSLHYFLILLLMSGLMHL